MAGAAAEEGGWTDARSAAGTHNPWLIVGVISLATFMEVLDTSIANVALNNIAGGLAVSVDQATWVLTSYLVANAIVIPISGWLSDIVGRKRYYMLSVALFTFSSLLCGLAPNFETLILARVLQGIGGGGLAVSEQSILADTFPPSKRGMAFAAYAVVVIIGPVFGPTVGGFLTDRASWHWIFLINVPVGIMALALVQTFVTDPEQVKEDRRKKMRRGLRVDYIGFALVALGLGFFEITLDRGEREDWFSSGFITISAVICVVSLVALVIWELRHRNPIIELRLLARRNFGITVAVMMTVGVILYSTTQLIPQMLQEVLGYSALDAGLALTVGGFATLLAVPFAGKLTDKLDPRWLLFPALLVTAGALWNMSQLNADIGFSDAAIARMFQSIALPFLFIPINTAAYLGLPGDMTAQASSLLNVSRNIGGSIGISMAQTMLSNGRQEHQSRLVEQLNPLNPNFNDWMQRAQGVLGDAAGGTATQMAVLYRVVQQQASILSFLDVFRTLMWFVLIVAPFVLFLRGSDKKRKKKGGAA